MLCSDYPGISINGTHKMKQHTNKDQTAKLIELGFPKPTRIVAIGGFPPKDTLARYSSYKDDFDSVTCYEGYSIGELIEFLEHRIYRIENDMQWLVDGARIYRADDELINALFEACVTLKEEGLV